MCLDGHRPQPFAMTDVHYTAGQSRAAVKKNVAHFIFLLFNVLRQINSKLKKTLRFSMEDNEGYFA